MKTWGFHYLFGIILYAFSAPLFAEPIRLEMWHAMEGFIEEKLKDLVSQFNVSQNEYQIHLTYKGNYTVTFNEGLKAAKAETGFPHILQVYEIATPTFRLETDLYIPAGELLQKHGYAFSEGLIPAIIDFYSNDKGQVQGLPFNISTGLLFYNKDAFKKAGINSNAPPQTWEDVETYAVKLKNAGYSCAITTAWPSGYLLEHFGARHNLPFATQDNGFNGSDAQLVVNTIPYIFNIVKFAEWQKKGTFKYGGRFVADIEPLFTKGQCAMIMQSNSRMAILKKDSKFEVGGGPLPYWSALTKEPHNLVTGGAALWALKGHSDKEEKGIAAFFSFVAQPENQQAWVEATGYLPISKAAFSKLEASGYYKKNPHNEIAIQSLMLPSTPYSRGIRIPQFIEIREILIDALEEAFLQQKPVTEALDKAMNKGNELLGKTKT